MKASKKILSLIIVFFLIIAIVIVARTVIGNHFQKKFSKRPPPGIIVFKVSEKYFSEKIESFGTAIPKKTESFRIQKNNLASELKLQNYDAKKLDFRTFCAQHATVYQQQIVRKAPFASSRKNNVYG